MGRGDIFLLGNDGAEVSNYKRSVSSQKNRENLIFLEKKVDKKSKMK